MWKKENWLFGFSLIGAIAAVLKIAEYFGVKGISMSLTHPPALLVWAIILASSSLLSSFYGFYYSIRTGRGLKRKALLSNRLPTIDASQVQFDGSLNVLVNRRNGASEFRFKTTGQSLSELQLGLRPIKIRLICPIDREIEEQELSVQLPVEGGYISINAFSDTGIILNDRGIEGVQVNGYVLLSAEKAY